MSRKRLPFLIIAIVFAGIMFFGGQYIMLKYYPEHINYIIGGMLWAVMIYKGLAFIGLLADYYAPRKENIKIVERYHDDWH